VSEGRRVEKLRPITRLKAFDCGREELNRYLQGFAWQNQQTGAAKNVCRARQAMRAGTGETAGRLTFGSD
jgi:hypothetical protein